MEDLIVNINGKEHRVKVEETEQGRIRVHHNGEAYEVETKSDVQPAVREEIEKKLQKKEHCKKDTKKKKEKGG